MGGREKSRPYFYSGILTDLGRISVQWKFSGDDDVTPFLCHRTPPSPMAKKWQPIILRPTKFPQSLDFHTEPRSGV